MKFSFLVMSPLSHQYNYAFVIAGIVLEMLEQQSTAAPLQRLFSYIICSTNNNTSGGGGSSSGGDGMFEELVVIISFLFPVPSLNCGLDKISFFHLFAL